jgi:predicted dehydrogenase
MCDAYLRMVGQRPKRLVLTYDLIDHPMPLPRRQFLASTAALASGVFAAAHASRAADAARAPRIKIGQIGVGHAHASKLGVYRASDDYEVVGVFEPDETLRQRAESDPTYQGLKWLTREALLSTPGLQAVLVETRVRDLLANARVCVDAGLHIHIDKPAGESLADLKQIFEIATQKKLLVQMGYMFRYNPGVVLLREFLKKGWLGEVFEVHTVMSKVVGAAQRQEFAEYPGGSMFELGCHVLDLVVGILGAPQKVTAFPRHSSPSEDKLLDNMLAVLEYPRATATVRSSVIEIDGGSRRHLTVCGTEGTFHIQPLDNPSAKITLPKPQGTYQAGTQEIKLPKYTRYVDDARDMARIIRGEKPSDFPPSHDLAVQTALLQACEL